MEKYKKNIDDLFKNRLGDYAEAPPPLIWNVLEKRLNGERGERKFFSIALGYFYCIAYLTH